MGIVVRLQVHRISKQKRKKQKETKKWKKNRKHLFSMTFFHWKWICMPFCSWLKWKTNFKRNFKKKTKSTWKRLFDFFALKMQNTCFNFKRDREEEEGTQIPVNFTFWLWFEEVNESPDGNKTSKNLKKAKKKKRRMTNQSVKKVLFLCFVFLSFLKRRRRKRRMKK